MPNTLSAKKAHRKSQKRAAINRSRKSDVRTHLKKARLAIEALKAGNGDFVQVQDLVRLAESKVHKRAACRVISKKSASRKISNLVRHLKPFDPSYQKWQASLVEN